jgi:hypothetical protein
MSSISMILSAYSYMPQFGVTLCFSVLDLIISTCVLIGCCIMVNICEHILFGSVAILVKC